MLCALHLKETGLIKGTRSLCTFRSTATPKDQCAPNLPHDKVVEVLAFLGDYGCYGLEYRLRCLVGGQMEREGGALNLGILRSRAEPCPIITTPIQRSLF